MNKTERAAIAIVGEGMDPDALSAQEVTRVAEMVGCSKRLVYLARERARELMREGGADRTCNPAPVPAVPATAIVAVDHITDAEVGELSFERCIEIGLTPRQACAAAGVPYDVIQKTAAVKKAHLIRRRMQGLAAYYARLDHIALGRPVTQTEHWPIRDPKTDEIIGVGSETYERHPTVKDQLAALERVIAIREYQAQAGVDDDAAFIDTDATIDPVAAMLEPVFPEMEAVDLMEIDAD